MDSLITQIRQVNKKAPVHARQHSREARLSLNKKRKTKMGGGQEQPQSVSPR
jgi:hypothetical protein